MNDYNREKVDEVVLALMYLNLHDYVRAWKSFDWDALDRLHEKGWISDPKSKAKSVVFSEEGLAEHAPDMGGPQVRTIEEMTEAYLRIRDRRATVRSEAPSGDLFEVFRSGINLVPEHAVGTITWEAFLHHAFDH